MITTILSEMLTFVNRYMTIQRPFSSIIFLSLDISREWNCNGCRSQYHAPLRVRSAIQRHQSPERLILSQFSGFMQLQIQGRDITLDGLHSGSRWPPRWTSPALGRRLKMTCLSSAFSSILTRCLKKERRRELTMDESGGWLVTWRMSAFLTKSCQWTPRIRRRQHWCSASTQCKSALLIAQHSDP